MKLQAALQGVSSIYLDTSPVIYYVEAVPEFSTIIDPIFGQIESGILSAIASPVTLSECLVIPLRTNNLTLQQNFIALLTNTEGIQMVDIQAEVGQIAADLRNCYTLKLPDALQIATAMVKDRSKSIASNCDAFLTNDEQLKRVQELNVIVIKDLEV